MKTAILQKIHWNTSPVAVALVAAVLALLFVILPVTQTSALNANQEAVCESIGSGKDCGTSTTGGSDVNNVITTGINLFSAIIGIVAVIMIVVAGFKFITSSGDSAKLTSAKSTLMYALVGLVIVVLSQVIVRFVLSRTVDSTSITCPSGQVPDANGTACIPSP
jgi:hypothetical protein